MNTGVELVKDLFLMIDGLAIQDLGETLFSEKGTPLLTVLVGANDQDIAISTRQQ